MIEFIKSIIDDEVRRLIMLLEPNYPADKVILEIEKGFAIAVKVLFNKELIGLLILKHFNAYDGKKVLVVEHGVTQVKDFSQILSKTIFSYAYSMGYDEIHQHADTKALMRLYEKFYGEAQESIFKKDLNLWAKAHPHLQLRKPQPAQQRT